MAKKQSNTMKYALFAVIGLAALVFGIPLLGGIFSSVNPGESIQMAQQKTMEDLELALPDGYQYLTKAERIETADEVIYVTRITNGGPVVSLIKQTRLPACKGEFLTQFGVDVCKNIAVDTTGAGPNLDLYSWESASGAYQLDVPQGALTEEQIRALILSVS